MKKHLLFLLLLGALVGACSSGPPRSVGPVEVSEGDLHVRMESVPSPPREGENVTFTITARDAYSGEPLQDVEVRPVIDMYMATSRMLVPFDTIRSTGPGEVQVQAFLEHVGTLKISVGVNRDGVITPVRLPDVPIQPAQ
ncbi:MAG: hypothetical protein M3220_17300 [Chloroflexota bacterium]|nr:hypothetical protein [Chloroflexota bacterium]